MVKFLKTLKWEISLDCPTQSHASLRAKNFSSMVKDGCDERRARDAILLVLKRDEVPRANECGIF